MISKEHVFLLEHDVTLLSWPHRRLHVPLFVSAAQAYLCENLPSVMIEWSWQLQSRAPMRVRSAMRTSAAVVERISQHVAVMQPDAGKMAISLSPEDGGGNDDLLLKTSETLLQMAAIARVNHVDENTSLLQPPRVPLPQVARLRKARTADLVSLGQRPGQSDAGSPRLLDPRKRPPGTAVMRVHRSAGLSSRDAEPLLETNTKATRSSETRFYQPVVGACRIRVAAGRGG